MTTTQVAKQLSTGQSWLWDWTNKVSARVNSYQSRRLCCLKNIVAQSILLHKIPGFCGDPGKFMGRPRLINQAATKIWRRDQQELVSSLFLGMVGETSSDLSYCLVYSAGQGRWVAGADEQDDYLCPWSILHKEAAGRSWVINNTSNVSGVE